MQDYGHDAGCIPHCFSFQELARRMPQTASGGLLQAGSRPPVFAIPSPSSDVEVTPCALVDANISRGMSRTREWAITY
jgi:hypothetical protein